MSGFRTVGGSYGEPYPEWLRELSRRRASGVYIIRDKRSKRVLYIGHSRTGRLYGTLTRHFQEWSDRRRTAGARYDRSRVEVQVRVTASRAAMTLEERLIFRHCPRDNFDPGCDEVPF